MDLLINPTLENARRVKSAFQGWNHHDLSHLDPEKLALPNKQIPVFDMGVRIGDVLTPKPGFDSCKAFSRSGTEVIDGIPVRIASTSELKTLNSLRQQSEKLEGV